MHVYIHIQLNNNTDIWTHVVPHVWLHDVLDVLMLASWTNTEYDEFDKGGTGVITCGDA